jgi:molybdopterin molybdotransferase
MALLPVSDALERLLDGAAPSGAETVKLANAAGRVLAEPLMALRTQPPFAASAMDGYALRSIDAQKMPAPLTVIGMAAAGRPFDGEIGPGQAVRIFTGAPLPGGADAIVIQEDVRALEDSAIEVLEAATAGRHIRAKGLDFAEGDKLLEAGRVLDPAALSLAASANHPTLKLMRSPLVAIIATGDELLAPGSDIGPGQIISSNAYGVAAIVEQAGARTLDLGIAPDRLDALSAKIRTALEARADVIVTLGGASVGDHDLVREALTGLGMSLNFWKIAMRPGKPLMFGTLGRTRCIGLPGNPVASLVCSHLFLKPLVERLSGRPHASDMRHAVLGKAMGANDQRQDHVRAFAEPTAAGLMATPFNLQDSSMLKMLADANCLIVREPFAPAAEPGAECRVLMLR